MFMQSEDRAADALGAEKAEKAPSSRGYSDDPALAAEGERCPVVSASAKKFLAEAEDLPTALFDLADLFRTPVTNNIPWYEGGDKNKPIYHVGEFIDEVIACFERAGWSPPDPQQTDVTRVKGAEESEST